MRPKQTKLTENQIALVEFVGRNLSAGGFAPTARQISDELWKGLTGQNSIQNVLYHIQRINDISQREELGYRIKMRPAGKPTKMIEIDKGKGENGHWLCTSHGGRAPQYVAGNGQIKTYLPPIPKATGPDGVRRFVYEIAWMMVNGQIPDNRPLINRCGSRMCVNPAHYGLSPL